MDTGITHAAIPFLPRTQRIRTALPSLLFFYGDFGDGSERCLKDKIDITRKSARYHICDEIIPPKSTARLSTWVFDGEIMTTAVVPPVVMR
ncbi:hypothetical protein [Xenorhabdus sp. BG5]|uniref:hypothetical protein n=1 Tax=Xenorhabdus sp. BG5 TaxID=2782014 RepID=UPI0018817758|nr:hypothetical protein [Xenorhabdus sp. BG5]MBE8596746.1 hypothetical protein [Xenorhabdus sp. BG5]